MSVECSACKAKTKKSKFVEHVLSHEKIYDSKNIDIIIYNRISLSKKSRKTLLSKTVSGDLKKQIINKLIYAKYESTREQIRIIEFDMNSKNTELRNSHNIKTKINKAIKHLNKISKIRQIRYNEPLEVKKLLKKLESFKLIINTEGWLMKREEQKEDVKFISDILNKSIWTVRKK